MREIIRNSDIAPGVAGGATFGRFDHVVTHGRNRVGFLARLTGDGIDSSNRAGIWGASESGVVHLLARSGDLAPVADEGVHFGIIGRDRPLFLLSPYENPPFTFNASGEAAFHVSLVGPGAVDANDRGIFVASEGGTRLIVRKGDETPGIPGGKFYTFPFTAFGLAAPALNEYGQTAFLANLEGPTIVQDNSMSLWTKTATGSLTLVAQTGGPAPGISDEQTLLAELRSPRLNDAGHVAFTGRLSGPNVDSSNDEAMWMGTPGNLALIMREGEPVPGAIGAIKFGIANDAVIPVNVVPILNERGQTLFSSELLGEGITADNDSAIWLWDPGGGMRLVAREGDMAPGGGVFSMFYKQSFRLSLS